MEDPQNPDHCRLNLSVSDLSVACSGDYHRKFEFQGKRYGHIVDIRTGFPVDHEVRSVTVVANRCTVAGLLATSAFILGPKEGLHMLESFPGAAGLLTCKDRTLQTREFQRYVLP